MKRIYLFGLLVFIACHQGQSHKIITQKGIYNEVEASRAELQIPHFEPKGKVEGAIGLITTSGHYEFGDSIEIFDKYRKVQRIIVITEEYQKLSLKCLSKDDLFYKVQSENDEIGFIPKNEKKVIFQTWEEHILSVFSVGFDEVSNPILESPSENSKKVTYDKDDFYYPIKIKRDWLQVKWGSDGDWKYGWIRWKEGEKLVIQLFYFA